MGGCCSKNEGLGSRHRRYRGRGGGLGCVEEEEEGDVVVVYGGDDEVDASVHDGPGGVRVRLKGSCGYASMHTQQGWKGVNQDAMTIWEEFGGDKDTVFCGVFDGHGPLGHKVAYHIRDALPLKLHSEKNSSQQLDHDNSLDAGDDKDQNECISFWKSTFIKSYEDLDKELSKQSAIDCICSGSTAVSLIKQREHLIIANLGDSRAILCSRDGKNRLIPIQLTVDLKPNLPSETERILSCKGRVFALEEEPDVHRLWLPTEDSPGLAMARAFGDFCLKDFGLISTPLVSYRKLTEKDEFVVIASDGIWDVLSNKEVIKIVSTARKRSDVAKNLVDGAIRAWRSKHPTSKVDDCAVICLFLKDSPSSSNNLVVDDHKKSTRSRQESIESFTTARSESYNTTQGEELSQPEDVAIESSKEEWTALEGLSRVNSLIRVPRFASMLSWRKKSPREKENEELIPH